MQDAWSRSTGSSLGKAGGRPTSTTYSLECVELEFSEVRIQDPA
jgi:hypothetical protein